MNNEDGRPIATEPISKHNDIAGQLGLTLGDGDVYCKPPDAACAKNAKPVEPPVRAPAPKVQERHQLFNLKNPSLIQWADKDGHIVETQKHTSAKRTIYKKK